MSQNSQMKYYNVLKILELLGMRFVERLLIIQ
jgi:hypothetical protein